jgi:hypothetical protein
MRSSLLKILLDIWILDWYSDSDVILTTSLRAIPQKVESELVLDSSRSGPVLDSGTDRPVLSRELPVRTGSSAGGTPAEF